MARTSNVHDRFFKQLFARRDLVVGFCQHYLPRSVAAGLRLNPGDLEPLPTEFSGHGIPSRRADVAFRIPRRDGSPLSLYLVVEHKSRAELLTRPQLARYCIGYWEDQLAKGLQRLSPILPVVVYHGARPWLATRDLGDIVDAPAFLRGFRPRLRYHLVSLTPQDPPPRRGPIGLRVGLEVLQAAFRSDFEAHLSAAIARLEVLRLPDLIAQDLEPILLYANQVSPQLTADRLITLVDNALPLPKGAVMDKTFERLIQQGRTVGLQEGLQQGHLAGLQEGVAWDIEARFGTAGLALLPQLQRIQDLDALRKIRRELPHMTGLAELRRLLGAVAGMGG